jgi:hypothetical protein
MMSKNGEVRISMKDLGFFREVSIWPWPMSKLTSVAKYISDPISSHIIFGIFFSEQEWLGVKDAFFGHETK